MKKIMIAGMGGQLGFELARTSADASLLVAPKENELDITDRESVNAFVSELRPAVIINCAAYTQVDKAESESEKAFAVNRDGPAYLAQAAKACNALLVHISTDFVFAGTGGNPLRTDDAAAPLSVYGKSKLAGEEEIARVGGDALIIRTAWLYSSFGNNFVKTMLRLMNERDSLGIVADQVGTPTWANSLARVIWQLIDLDARGLYHWTDAGVASWYDFAVAIYEEGRAAGLLSRDTEIKPIKTSDYPLPAARPAFSVLDKSSVYALTGGKPEHWRANLRKMLSELR